MKTRVAALAVLVMMVVTATPLAAKSAAPALPSAPPPHMLVSAAHSVQDPPEVLDPDQLYVPAMTEAYFADTLRVTRATAPDLPEVAGFWTDLVNREMVPEDGDGVYVAVLDTGLLSLWPFFFSQATVAEELGRGFTHEIRWDDEAEALVLGPLQDDRGFITGLASGHGTHVVSTVVGYNDGNTSWVTGVAPRATIIPVLVMDAWTISTPDGPVQIEGGTDEMVAAGIRYVAELAPALDGPVVINLSLGGPGPSPEIEAAIDDALELGVIVVAAAGNAGADGMTTPGAYPQVVSTGAAGWAEMFLYGWSADAPEALNSRDGLGNAWQIYLEDFSSRPNPALGQKHRDLDMTAPGAWVRGPYKPAFSSAIAYYYVSGTSMAAAHVSGIAALVRQTHPDLTQTQVEFVLKLASQRLPLPASDAIVPFPFNPAGYYTATWDGGDAGAGFLQTDAALRFAGLVN